MTSDNNYKQKSNTDNIVLAVQRGKKIFRFTKMWGYMIKIPGLLPTMPLPWYYYIGITTKDDPMFRVKQHVTEKKKNPKFEEIRKNIQFDLWEITLFELPIIGEDGEQNLDRLKQWEKETIAKYNTFHGEHGLNASPGGEDPFASLPNSEPAKTFGANHICIRQKPHNIEFMYQINRTHTPYFSITSTKPSKFLRKLIDHPSINLQEIFFNFNFFIYSAAAAQLGHLDLKLKRPKETFVTEDQFNACYNFTLDCAVEAVWFLQEIEAGVIPDRIKVLLPKDINTRTNKELLVPEGQAQNVV